MVNTLNGMGDQYAKFFREGFAKKLDLAQTEEEKWRIRSHRKNFLARQHAIIARRAWAILSDNAYPRGGGFYEPAPEVPFA